MKLRFLAREKYATKKTGVIEQHVVCTFLGKYKMLKLVKRGIK